MTTDLATPDPGDLMTLAVRDTSPVTADISRFELAHPEGCEPPAFPAGSHVVVAAPKGHSRRYSVGNAPGERHRYVIA